MSQVHSEPALREIDVTPGHDSFSPTITDSGADVIIEHGVVTGEVRGL
jgi:hypothetical protein